MQFHIKICGVRFKSDVDAVEQAGGDAIGLNFFPPSVRYVDPTDAATGELCDHGKSLGLKTVGVFVNESAGSVGALARDLGLDVIQLHGDETLEDVRMVRLVTSKPILRAIKLPTGPLSVEAIASKAQPWVLAGCDLVLDADAGASHGGSGKALNWPSVQAWAESYPRVNWTLAGGLTPENVAEAMKSSGAISVDTAGGTEDPKGTKSAARIAAFVSAAKRSQSP